MRTERLVLDTNVFVSALLFESSTPARVLEHAFEHCQVIFTNDTQRELIATMTSAKLDRYVSAVEREQLLRTVMPLIELVSVWQPVRVCRDPHDDALLEAAFNGGADAIVTGDKDLLALHPFRGIAVLTPATYLSAVASEQKPKP
jgi:putative PIN family toxin of toxin-antitoxin system